MRFARIAASLIMLLFASHVFAEERGQWLLGSGGLDSWSQPSPGIYYSELVTFYHTDIPPNTSLSLVIDQVTLGWVSNFKIFGGTYGFDLQPSLRKLNDFSTWCRTPGA